MIKFLTLSEVLLIIDGNKRAALASSLVFLDIGLVRQLVSFGLWPKQLPHKSCIFRTKVLKKCCFYKEVVQKLKFPNNSINEFEFYCKDAILYNEIMDLAKGKVKKEELIKFYEKYSRKK